MELAADITADDLKMFLQEADEILLLLDECILKLERDGEDSELIQEIFRAAHTLKGSSAMLGFPPMTELGHAMETLLDKIRKGTAKATTQVVDALLHSLDLLQALKDSLETGEDTTVDTSAVVAELERAGQVEGEGGGAEAATIGPLKLEVTGDALSRVHSILESGEAVQRIQVLLKKDTDWAAVRCFQILNELLPLGEVLVSVPTQADIEAGENVGSEMLLLLATNAPEDKLQEVMKTVEDVEEIKVTPFTDADLTASAPEQAPTPISEGQTQAKEGGNSGPKRGAASSQTVRIDVERLDGLMNMIGELVIDRTRILQIAKMMEAKHPDDDLVDSLTETSAHIVKVVDQLQEDFMQVRMLPIGTVFSGFPRMLRDMAQKMEKPLDFQIDGQDTEIDRTVIERIRDPLVHLLRNALDHGVEDPEARKAAGKDPTATIKLSAHHEQNHIIITVEDDG
ncbi:MAG: Hpt domain-containing protein, partial [Chloroflexi bacterium]|nr:Hpt domain-containing protein [Chloroflexota bacterium]